jgi:rhodanese-related sulfurtransferase
MLTSFNSYSQKTDLSVPEFEKVIGQTNVQLLDVRTVGEYHSGHLTNALLADWTNEKEFKESVQALDKTKPIYTYCLSGARSNAATQWLRQNGFTAYNLSGGINAWKNADKPLAQAVAVEQITMQEYLAQIPAGKTVLVDFSAIWCPPCKKMAPVLDSLVAAHGSKFILVKIDGGEQFSICKELAVEALPTFIIYKKGKSVWRKRGMADMQEFVKQL